MTTASIPDTANHTESLFDLVMAASLEGIVEHDLVHQKTRYDVRWRRLLGFDAENDVDNRPDVWLELSHPDDVQELRRLWEDHVQQAWPFQHTWRMRHRHGGYRWVRCRSALRLDDEGLPIRAVSLFSDITETVEATQRHKALVEAIPDTILRIGNDGIIQDLRLSENANETTLFGAARIGTPLLEKGHPEFTRRLMELVRRSTSGEQGVKSEWSYAGETTRFHFEVRVTAIGSHEAVCIIRDVTEQRQLEEQLIQAQKLESIGQLAAGVAHEINTPLQFIGDNVHFMKKAMERLLPLIALYQEASAQPSPPKLLDKLHKAEKRARSQFLLERIPRALEASLEGVERVADIIRSMKDFAYPGSDRPLPADINRALRSTAKVSTTEWKRSATLVFELDEELPHISCYIGELSQCFLNIIINAAHAIADKFGESQAGRIIVHTERYENGVEIRISDNGPGMTESIKKRIFDPFFTTKQLGRGTGQGLSMVRRTVVEKHQGEIWCETAIDQGTAFVIRLPSEIHMEKAFLPYPSPTASPHPPG